MRELREPRAESLSLSRAKGRDAYNATLFLSLSPSLFVIVHFNVSYALAWDIQIHIEFGVPFRLCETILNIAVVLS